MITQQMQPSNIMPPDQFLLLLQALQLVVRIAAELLDLLTAQVGERIADLIFALQVDNKTLLSWG